MNQSTGSFLEKMCMSMFVAMLMLVSFKAQAATTVTVDDNNKVTVTQPSTAPRVVTETVVVNQTPVIVTQQTITGDFEGRIVEIDYPRNQMVVYVTDGSNREVSVRPEMINSYRIGDYVLIHPSATVTLITLEENPKDFEGEIIRIEQTKNQMVVQDTTGRERRVQLKEGMISTYKVDDYVRVHLMADLKEAKTIETISDVRNLEGNIVNIDYARSQIIVRNSAGQDSAVFVRQGQINNYRIGERVRIYLLANRDQVQVIRVIR